MKFAIPVVAAALGLVGFASTASAQQPYPVVPTAPPVVVAAPPVVAVPPVVVAQPAPVIVAPAPVYPAYGGVTVVRPGIGVNIGIGVPAFGYARPYYGYYGRPGYYHHHYHR